MVKSHHIIYLLILGCITVFFFACQKHSAQPVIPPNVYIVGESNNSGIFWNAGRSEYLTDSIIGFNGSGAYSLFVTGNDVYIGGEISTINQPNTPAYWKNGVITYLTTPVNNNNAWVNSIFVSGNDVYAAGTAGEWSDTYAVLWKNGAPIILDSIIGPAGIWGPACSANSVFVSGSDVYVAGSGPNGAFYWKNGVITNLASAVNTGATSVYVTGNDVYIAADVPNNSFISAAYWKDGVPVTMTASSTGNSTSRSIFVVSQDVYVCGYQTINDSSVATYWKNGLPTVLGSISGSSSDSYSIFVDGEDIYVTGIDGNVGCYWKNGIEIPLAFNAIALNIYVK